MDELGSKNEDEVILIKFIDKEIPKRSYGSSLSYNNEDTSTYSQTSSSNQISNEAEIVQFSNETMKNAMFGSITLWSMNNILISSVVVYGLFLLLPRGVRKRIVNTTVESKIYKRLATVKTKEKAQESSSTAISDPMITTSTTPLLHKTKTSNQYNSVESWKLKKKQYDALFPNGDKSLVDIDSFSLQTVEEDASLSKTEQGLHCRKVHSNYHTHSRNHIRQDHKDADEKEDFSERKLVLTSEKNYGSSLSALDTSFVSTCSLEKASSLDNEELSPLECIKKNNSFEQVFRTKNGKRVNNSKPRTLLQTNQTKKVLVMAQQERQKQHKQKQQHVNPKESQPNNTAQPPPPPPPPPASSKHIQPMRTPSSSIVTNDVFSVATHLFSPQTINSNSTYSGNGSSKDKSVQNSNILVEKQMNYNQTILVRSKSDSNNTETITTPQSIMSGNSSLKSRNSTRMDFTPSPLSIFSNGTQGCQAVVILISSEIMYPEQHVQQQNALMILLSDKFHLPVRVVDGNQEKHRIRREELFRLSGIRGQYPQVFLVHESGKMKYVGNHLELDKMDDPTGSSQNHFSPSLLQTQMQLKGPNTVDASFFSI